MSDPKRPTKERGPDKDLPPAGPHAKPELTDPIKTPGSGALPKSDKKDVDVDSATG